MGVHDTDFCWRLLNRGNSLAFVPEAVVHVRYRSGAIAHFQQARSYGRGAVALYARHRASGMPALQLRDGLRGWALLALRMPRLARSGKRGRWFWKLGVRIGRLEACVEYRILAL